MTFVYRVDRVDSVANSYGVVLAFLVPVVDPRGEGRSTGNISIRTYDPALVDLLKVGAVVTLAIEDPS